MMSSLTEIENAIERLSPEAKQELLLFLATRLRADRKTPQPRQFGRERLDAWIADDEQSMREFDERP